ncbi:DHA2 family efflux MFS transporter permease subunit [Serratia marcescens]|nr:multidrug transporter subunit MdtD [Serratia marcescens]RTF23615.1 DHA2 family efflux MFS transporter permease subunit [Serratia marcescens]RTF60467.1 DHA2 family efflux MFS transporter permease subunit [Serratia marcescens]RTF74655.1 DHA2 family efflux MFS transporter permease subunit [Serratia marcescens]RTF77262.1 DHA2 family efflux MFS transporter permease subunit [Serratia marcescens]RTG28063.1 DHA2 family efflux MFS transporter permease subunit [Serratia marcescens]
MKHTATVRWQLWIVAFGFFMQTLDTTIVNTALPSMAASLGENPLRMQSVIVSYVLTVAVTLPASGWLADKIGVQRVFFSAIVLFTLGSLLCARSETLNELIASRVIQGVGGAMMVPVGRLTVMKIVPREQYMAAMTFVTLPGQIGPLMGPALGGFLVQYASWHWIFLINIPIGLLGIFYARKYMPDFTTPKRRFDFLGFMLFGLSLVLISTGLELFGERVLASYVSLGILLSGFVMLFGYIAHARRHPQPLIGLDLFKTRTFSVGIAGNVASRLGTGCVPFLMPLMLQVGFGYTAIVAGCMMAPTAIGSLMAKSTVTQVLRWFGYRKTLVGITVIIGVLIAQFALQSPGMPLWLMILPLFVLGMAMSTQFTAMNTISLADLNDANASAGNSVLAVTQQLSISFGVAISAAVLRFYESLSLGTMIDHFHYTFITMGIVTVASALVFMLLRRKDGRNLISGQESKKEAKAAS